jgi:hypothetical protein
VFRVGPVPGQLDGAVVLATADLSGSEPTGGTVHLINDEVLVTPAALALARYEGADGVYLFYCDPDWNVVTDTLHESATDAVTQAEFEFTNVRFVSRGD